MSEKKTLYPTGTCFEDVSWMFILMVKEKRSRIHDQNFFMVHGICEMPTGKLYSHAWIEDGAYAWFPVIIDGVKGFAQSIKEEFHAEFRVKEATRYTFHQARATALASGDLPPPWEEKYRRLCKDYKPQ